jgi:CheY-like chemotaxis protein
MSKPAQRRTILMVDDDGEDCILVGDALREMGRALDLHFVHNGDELFDYLGRKGEYADARTAPIPDLILLDLKMPRKDGRETLRDLKSDPHWRNIPVVVLTTSTASDDVQACYRLGVNSYIAKPSTYRKLVEVLELVTNYWFDAAVLPPKASHGGKTH